MEVDNTNFRSHGGANEMPVQVAVPSHKLLMNGGLEMVVVLLPLFLPANRTKWLEPVDEETTPRS